MVVLVDDAHWMDEVSALALAFAVRRLRDDQVAVVITTRAGHSSPLLGVGLRTVALEGIETASAARLARDIDLSITDSVAARRRRPPVGTPCWLSEVVTRLTPAQKTGGEAIGVPPPPSEGLPRAQTARLDALSPDARRSAVILAAGEGADADEAEAAAGRETWIPRRWRREAWSTSRVGGGASPTRFCAVRPTSGRPLRNGGGRTATWPSPAGTRCGRRGTWTMLRLARTRRWRTASRRRPG